MVSIQERFVIKRELWWRSYGTYFTKQKTWDRTLDASFIPCTSVELNFSRLFFEICWKVAGFCLIWGKQARFGKKMAGCSQFIVSLILHQVEASLSGNNKLSSALDISCVLSEKEDINWMIMKKLHWKHWSKYLLNMSI